MSPRFRSIVIAGQISSGTSTLSKLLAKKLGWPRGDAGEMVREVFKEHGWKLEEAAKMPPKLDRKIDQRLKKLAQKGKFIYEGHIAGWNTRSLPGVLRVLLIAEFPTRVRRFMKREKVSHQKAERLVRQRHLALVWHFRKLYKIKNRFDPKYFHLVLDTTKMTPEEEAKAIINFFKTGGT